MLRDAADAMLRNASFAALSAEQLLATERAAARLENRRIGAAPPDMRRLRAEIDAVWSRPGSAAGRMVAAALAARRRSLDRALILAWLRYHPAGHPDGEALRIAAAAAAGRHEWAWRDRAERWRLFSVGGPALIRAAIADGTCDDVVLIRSVEGPT